jgi:hypothetical protein
LTQFQFQQQPLQQPAAPQDGVSNPQESTSTQRPVEFAAETLPTSSGSNVEHNLYTPSSSGPVRFGSDGKLNATQMTRVEILQQVPESRIQEYEPRSAHEGAEFKGHYDQDQYRTHQQWDSRPQHVSEPRNREYTQHQSAQQWSNDPQDASQAPIQQQNQYQSPQQWGHNHYTTSRPSIEAKTFHQGIQDTTMPVSSGPQSSWNANANWQHQPEQHQIRDNSYNGSREVEQESVTNNQRPLSDWPTNSNEVPQPILVESNHTHHHHTLPFTQERINSDSTQSYTGPFVITQVQQAEVVHEPPSYVEEQSYTWQGSDDDDDPYDVSEDDFDELGNNIVTSFPGERQHNHLKNNDLGIVVALQAAQDSQDQGIRTIHAFINGHDNVLAHYRPSGRSSPLNDSTTARIFCHFINVTAPIINLYERHPANPSLIFQGHPIPKSQQHIWTCM